ncbi:MAG: ATP12 family protein [Pseudomonadota bacterium]
MKRFYTDVAVAFEDGGWSVTLDGKPIRTPAKRPCLAPTRAMADAIAEEWAAQEGELRPQDMPVTKALNTAIDRTLPEFDAVVEIVAAYGGSDLICYRADTPDGLRERQAAAWDPMMEWAEASLGSRLIATTGVMHLMQAEEALTRLGAEVAAHNAYELTGLHDLVALSGSLVLGLAVSKGRLSAPEAWASSRIDNIWQEEQWGVDEEAAASAAYKEREFLQAACLIELARSN